MRRCSVLLAILVAIMPEQAAAGEDPQIAKAVEVLPEIVGAR